MIPMMPVKQSLLVLSLVGLMLSCQNVALASMYDSGIQAYRNQQYAQAYNAFQNHLKAIGQNNRAAGSTYFYMGLTLARMQRFDEARNAFNRVLLLEPANSPTAVKARKNLIVIARAETPSESKAQRIASMAPKSGSSSTSSDYLPYVMHQGKVIHWNAQAMPIRVFITSGQNVPGWSPAMKNLVNQAMQTWQNASGGKIRMALTSTRDNADIVVRWTKNMEHNKLGENPFEMMGNTIVRSDITIALYDGTTGAPLSQQVLQHVATHELGHALGIQGHSPFQDDVMFFSITGNPPTTLSMRDTNTIRKLYALKADVQNSTAMSTAQVRQASKALQQEVSGLSRQELESDPDKALSVLQKALAINPDDPNLLLGLGGAYWNKRDWVKAEGYFRKTLKLEPENTLASYYLAGSLANQGMELGKAGRLDIATMRLNEAVQHYQSILQRSDAPADTRQNLNIALKNRQLVLARR